MAGAWSDPQWIGQVRAWVTEAECSAGHAVRSEGAQTHDQPWSTAILFETSGRRIWFKANGPGTRHEPRLLAVLADLVPASVPVVLAVNAERAWSLTQDAGPTLRSTRPAAELWPVWERLLQRYADTQLALAGHVPEPLATGMPERSPATLPVQTAALLEELAALPPAEGGLDATLAGALEARLTTYEMWCRELATSGIASTIQHDDLHSNNICWGGSVGRSRLIDWGDASIGHPLGTMLATLNSVAHHGGVEVSDPAVSRVRDAYLEPFTRLASRADLVHLTDVARRVCCVTRALSWQAALVGAPAGAAAGHDYPVRGWLGELLEV